MGQVYRFLGMSVGVIVHGLDDVQRKDGLCLRHFTYGTNNEFGFDYLRDNMKYDLAQMTQRGHHFSPSSNEVDFDSGRRGTHAADHFRPARRPVGTLHPDRCPRSAGSRPSTMISTKSSAPSRSMMTATSAWKSSCGEVGLLKDGDLYDAANATIVHHINQALRAHVLFTRDKDYIRAQ